MSKPYNVCVSTPTNEEFDSLLQPHTRAGHLFEQIAESLGLRQVEFFGLQYTDVLGDCAWLPLNKAALGRRDMPKKWPLRLLFCAKYYPEDVSFELVQDLAILLFYTQVKGQVLCDEIYCPPSNSILLASLALQADFGDWTAERGRDLDLAPILSSRILTQHKSSAEEWKERIIEWWREHEGMTKEGAMMDYLRAAQDLEMYGITYFEIKNKRGSDILLGVHALGLNIYARTDRLNPKVAFPWSEIHKILFIDRKFVIKVLEKRAPDFVFNARHARTNKKIFTLCIGNHELYKRRRSKGPPKSQPPRVIEYKQQLSVQQPSKAELENQRRIEEEQHKIEEEQRRIEEEQRRKEEQLRNEERRRNEEEKRRNEEELQKLRQEMIDVEVRVREQAAKKREENEERMKRVQEEMESLQSQKIQDSLTIRRLKAELKQENEMKEQLEKHQRELLAMVEQLAQSRELELEERMRMKEEIREKEEQVRKIQNNLRRQFEETERLQREAEEMREREAEMAEEAERLQQEAEEMRQLEAEESERLEKQAEELRKLEAEEARRLQREAEEVREWEAQMAAETQRLQREAALATKEREEKKATAIKKGRNSASSSDDAEEFEYGEHEPIYENGHLGRVVVDSGRNGFEDPHGTGSIISGAGTARGEHTKHGISEVGEMAILRDTGGGGAHSEKVERRQRKLRRLTQELVMAEIITNDTPEDKIYRENVRLGRDKYDTLRRVREGNTRRRVDLFENM